MCNRLILKAFSIFILNLGMFHNASASLLEFSFTGAYNYDPHNVVMTAQFMLDTSAALENIDMAIVSDSGHDYIEGFRIQNGASDFNFWLDGVGTFTNFDTFNSLFAPPGGVDYSRHDIYFNFEVAGSNLALGEYAHLGDHSLDSWNLSTDPLLDYFLDPGLSNPCCAYFAYDGYYGLIDMEIHPVPEPSVIGMLIISLGTLFFSRRKKLNI